MQDPKPPAAAQGVACCDVVNRGAVLDGGKLFFNTLDAHAVALDAATGKELWKTKLGVRGWLTALDAETGTIAWRAYST
jgi:outer membrane protein assembly factor BamB